MSTYRITIEMLDNPADEPTITVIECTTRYLLREDLPEWVFQEIDPNAEIRVEPVHPMGVNVCQECADDNHEDCRDGNRVSAVPFSCSCAIARHGGS